jgi:hypothetical protein
MYENVNQMNHQQDEQRGLGAYQGGKLAEDWILELGQEPLCPRCARWAAPPMKQKDAPLVTGRD